MAKAVKPTRMYRSERRREQAQQTRERILDAAQRLFTDRGFAGTTVAAIAAEAGTAAETVYATFESKPKLLGALVRRAVRGQDDAPVLDQAGPKAVATASDQREQLRLFANDVVHRLERGAPLIAVLSSAPAEPALSKLLEEIHQTRAANLRTVIDALQTNGPLRVSPEHAADTIWALASPELHNLLTRTRGWSRARYTVWLADSLVAVLLHPPDRR